MEAETAGSDDLAVLMPAGPELSRPELLETQSSRRPIGGYFPPGAPVAAVSRNPNQLDLFITGYNGVVYTNWWTAGFDWSGINNNWRPISPGPALTANPEPSQIGYGLSCSGTNFPAGEYEMSLNGFRTR
jgi:hypothetical protein